MQAFRRYQLEFAEQWQVNYDQTWKKQMSIWYGIQNQAICWCEPRDPSLSGSDTLKCVIVNRPDVNCCWKLIYSSHRNTGGTFNETDWMNDKWMTFNSYPDQCEIEKCEHIACLGNCCYCNTVITWNMPLCHHCNNIVYRYFDRYIIWTKR